MAASYLQSQHSLGWCHDGLDLLHGLQLMHTAVKYTLWISMVRNIIGRRVLAPFMIRTFIKMVADPSGEA